MGNGSKAESQLESSGPVSKTPCCVCLAAALAGALILSLWESLGRGGG